MFDISSPYTTENSAMIFRASDVLDRIGVEGRNGTLAKQDLVRAYCYCKTLNLSPELYCLPHPFGEPYCGYVLKCENFVDAVMKEGADELFAEHSELHHDSFLCTTDRVINLQRKHVMRYAHNFNQVCDRTRLHNTVLHLSETPLLQKISQTMNTMFGRKGNKLFWKMDMLYDLNKCGHKFKGQTEGDWGSAQIRLGAEVPIKFKWFYQNKAIEDALTIVPSHGSLIVLDGCVASGKNWRRPHICTIRHAEGLNPIFFEIPKPKAKIRKKKRWRNMDIHEQKEELSKVNAAFHEAYEPVSSKKRKKRKISFGANEMVTIPNIDEKLKQY